MMLDVNTGTHSAMHGLCIILRSSDLLFNLGYRVEIFIGQGFTFPLPVPPSQHLLCPPQTATPAPQHQNGAALPTEGSLKAAGGFTSPPVWLSAPFPNMQEWSSWCKPEAK